MTNEYDPQTNAAEWDERYSESDRMWSGNPNGSLVALVEEFTPGTAVDVGCGEGADALWLADRGWEVTAIDPSKVAIERAKLHDEHSRVNWLVAGVQEATLDGGFDLVVAMYPAITRGQGEEKLLDLVAPGGHLLFVHHVIDTETMESHPHFATMVMPDHIEHLANQAGWNVVISEDRERHVSHGRGAGHTTDRVVLVRKP
ncbi:class I SAM-dependent methyltransferase [Corynebacterium breve]|uniref:Class I SAM-dependent methyltransferase n=1 Tax=Corynebacterium breve TaxID=3049799 RepID=A0ABY8VJW6_9CORY|nr:class I SAM-dependent methyltransferase [Corynebacterium breve]WIM68523.1 class I SAM-dependent methyltransferase [Corynebacterium breve]